VNNESKMNEGRGKERREGVREKGRRSN